MKIHPQKGIIFLILLQCFWLACTPPGEQAYKDSFALRAAREIDSTGDTQTALFYVERALHENVQTQQEAKKFQERVAQRKVRVDDCILDKKVDLAMNRYPRIRHKHLFQTGICYEAAGEPVRALKFYDLSESLGSNQPQLYIRRGLLHEKLNDMQKAARDLEHAVVLNESYPPALLNFALFQIRHNNAASAQELLLKLKSVKPEYAEIVSDALAHQSEMIKWAGVNK